MKKKSLAEEIANLEITAPEDYDPEDVTEPLNDQLDQDDADHVDSSGARDHYINVSKSSLRNKQFLLDDPRYSGKQTSRKDIYSSDEEQEDRNPMSDAESDESDLEADLTAGDGDDNNPEDQVEQSEDEEYSMGSAEESDEEKGDDIQQELRRIEEEERAVILQMSKGTKGEVEKGEHVREQLKLWDQVLGCRIHSQKMVNIANQLPQHDVWPEFLAAEPGCEKDLDATKDELRQVIDELMSLRTSLLGEFGTVSITDCESNKRKRHLDDDDEYIEKLWDDISAINEVYAPFQNTTLEKWSNKVQASNGVNANKKFKAIDQNIISQINTVLADKSKLIERTQLQRSEYKILGKILPTTLEESEEETKLDRHLDRYDEEIFDDHDFYQQQLRELIDSRMVGTNDRLDSGKQWTAGRDTDSKRGRKKTYIKNSSKGRKLNFNVHEKIQNFMAPIPAGHWHEEMIDELYASLLGQRMATIHDEGTQ